MYLSYSINQYAHNIVLVMILLIDYIGVNLFLKCLPIFSWDFSAFAKMDIATASCIKRIMLTHFSTIYMHIHIDTYIYIYTYIVPILDRYKLVIPYSADWFFKQ